MKATSVTEKIEGTFAVPRYYISEGSPAYEAAQKMFRRIKWKKPPTKKNAINNRFNAFSSLPKPDSKKTSLKCLFRLDPDFVDFIL